ncbi:sulfate permease [Niabella terrae]
MFRPKLLETLRRYEWQQCRSDIIAGIIVGIVALPLAIAFAIASGVTPEKGLITAIIAGILISALGGSRVQIGGPTGAFIVIVYGIVQSFGVGGLIIATFMAGILLIIMGLARLGSVIKFIPYPLITGFTSGIALIIFSAQLKDLLGLEIANLAADFPGKWQQYIRHLDTTNWYALGTGLFTISIIALFPRITRKIPGTFIALILTTLLVNLSQLPVETIGTRFGSIPDRLPAPGIPDLSYETVRKLIQPAFTIALLGGIESLLSAVVADGMIGGRHKSNMELVAQGIANIGSAVFGGIPATGAIARTATNIKNGGRTPVAGIVHGLTLLLIMLFAGRWAVLIPLPALAAILIVVAYNMSEWESFRRVLRGPANDRVVLLVTFLLTVFVDLTVAIEIGMILAAFLFIRHMIKVSSVGPWLNDSEESQVAEELPEGLQVFEISGPLFFGAADKFREAMRFMHPSPEVLILRMGEVPVIDATGIYALREIHRELVRKGSRLILSDITSPSVLGDLRKARLLFAIGKANVTPNLEQALERAGILLKDRQQQPAP